MSQQTNGSRGVSLQGYYYALLIAAGLCMAIMLIPSLRSKAASATRLPVEGNMPPLDGAIAWINSPPLKTADLRGKVVLVEFWTYTREAAGCAAAAGACPPHRLLQHQLLS
jgi:hypothetical protein